nr:MAG TPA: hypothetical protein [Caudoviricetes sp.]
MTKYIKYSLVLIWTRVNFVSIIYYIIVIHL